MNNDTRAQRESHGQADIAGSMETVQAAIRANDNLIRTIETDLGNPEFFKRSVRDALATLQLLTEQLVARLEYTVGGPAKLRALRETNAALHKRLAILRADDQIEKVKELARKIAEFRAETGLSPEQAQAIVDFTRENP